MKKHFENITDSRQQGKVQHNMPEVIMMTIVAVIAGGEWQRVVIARGLYRFHNLIVLDEPTSAIDPIEENKIYRQFLKISFCA